MRGKIYIGMVLFMMIMLGNISCKKPRNQRLREEEKADRAQYIKDNNISADNKTSSGLYYIVLEEGDGEETVEEILLKGKMPKIFVWYTGYFLDGTIFDSNEDEGRFEPFSFYANPSEGRVIQGWYEGIYKMRKGERARFIIPSDLAYGSMGSMSGSSIILPYTTIIFDIEVDDIKY